MFKCLSRCFVFVFFLDEQITMSDMIRVREKQQQLARLHFELNNQQTNEKFVSIHLAFENDKFHF